MVVHFHVYLIKIFNGIAIWTLGLLINSPHFIRFCFEKIFELLNFPAMILFQKISVDLILWFPIPTRSYQRGAQFSILFLLCLSSERSSSCRWYSGKSFKKASKVPLLRNKIIQIMVPNKKVIINQTLFPL